MMIPGPVLMVPLYTEFRAFGWVGTLLPLWVPAFFGGAFNIFLMRQFFLTIPEELTEAARIDGCSEWTIFWRIVLPLSKPVLAVVALFTFLGGWNDFMGPLVMLRDQSRFPLSLGLFGMNIDQLNDTTLIMAGNMLMTIPVVVIFFLFQRYFIEGVTVSGMKG